MTSTPEIIRRIWDEGRLTTADIAEMTGAPEAAVSATIAEHVALKARARAVANRQGAREGENGRGMLSTVEAAHASPKAD